MLFEAFIEDDAPSFLSQGKTVKRAKEMAERFLEHFNLPTDQLRLKRFKRPPKKKPQQRFLKKKCS